MRTVSIDIKNTSQSDRIKLYDHLKALGEPIYSGTGLRDSTFNMKYFKFTGSNAEWSVSSSSRSIVLSIDQFIEKFPLPSVKSAAKDVRDFSIICEGSSLDDRKTIYYYLKKLGEPMYSDTGFIVRSSQSYEGSSTVFRFNSSEWSTGDAPKNSTLVTATDFINQFINSGSVVSKQQYTPGDLIKIRSDLKYNGDYDVHVNESMAKLAGKTIKLIYLRARTYKSGKPLWKIDDNLDYDWSEDLFEPFIKEATPEKEPEMDIKVGDVYKNSSGNLNTITRIVSHDYIYYTVSTGREYHAKLSVIEKNWKKVLQPATDQSTTIPKYLDRTDIRAGDYVERTKILSIYNDLTPAFVAKTNGGDKISLLGSDQGFWDMENFKIINPLHPSHPNYVTLDYYTPSSETIITSTTKILQPLTEYLKTNSIKVGDTLKINTDLKNHHNANSLMCSLAGELVTITSLKNRIRSGLDFRGAGSAYWDTSMFEAIEIEIPVSTVAQQSTFKVGDKVKLRDALELDVNSSIKTKYPKGFMFIGASGVLLEVEKVSTFEDGSPRHLIVYSTTRTTYYTNATEDFIAEEILKHTKTITVVDSIKIKTMAAVATTTGITIQPQIKKESEKKSMAKAIKDTALQTVGDNKQALIIAGKMEAGRVLNRQVLKQIKPHVPMFVRGYLDTPLAPVVVANLVAAVGNHTQNKRVQQVAELMLLAAADATVQSFNIDKIIDDVLAGVKLPAGVLDTDEE